MSVALAARVLQEERDRLLLPLRVQRAVVPAMIGDCTHGAAYEGQYQSSGTFVLREFA